MKKPKPSALAAIRSATGTTVRQFGALVGVSDALVTHMEHGKRAITAPVAAAIMAATGADSDALRQGKARCLRGRPYNGESFTHWCEAGGNEDVVGLVAERAAEMARALVLASASNPDGKRQPGRFHAVSLKLSMALDELAASAGLRDSANAQMLQRATQHDRRIATADEAKRLYGRSRSWPEIAKRIGKAQTVEVAEVTAPMWTRFSGRVELPDKSIAYGEACLIDGVNATVRLPGSSSRPMVVAPFVRSEVKLLVRDDQAARKGTTLPAPLIRRGGSTAKIRSAGPRRIARS